MNTFVSMFCTDSISKERKKKICKESTTKIYGQVKILKKNGSKEVIKEKQEKDRIRLKK